MPNDLYERIAKEIQKLQSQADSRPLEARRLAQKDRGTYRAPVGFLPSWPYGKSDEGTGI